MKSFVVRVLAAAEADFDEALEYYRDISPQLGQNFIIQVGSSMDDLKKNPYYQVRYDNFRMKMVKKFPYIIHYILDEERSFVYVYGIRNSYQDPNTYPRI